MSLAAESTADLISSNLKYSDSVEKKRQPYDYMKVLKAKRQERQTLPARKKHNFSKSNKREKCNTTMPKGIIPPKQEECSPEMTMHKARRERLQSQCNKSFADSAPKLSDSSDRSGHQRNISFSNNSFANQLKNESDS